MERAWVDLSNLDVPYLCVGTFIKLSMRFLEVFLVRMEIFSGMTFAVFTRKAAMLS